MIFIVVFCLLALSVVYALIMMQGAPSGISNKEYELAKSDYVLVILQCLVGMVVIFIPYRVEKMFGIYIPDLMEILYFLFLFCAIYLGEVQNFYYRIPFWDSILHGFSAGMLSALGFMIVDVISRSKRNTVSLSPFFVSLFAFCFATTCGALWEVYEYLADHLLGTNMQKFMTSEGIVLAGHEALGDTMKDIMVNLLGTLVVVAIGYLHLKRQETAKNRLMG